MNKYIKIISVFLVVLILIIGLLEIRSLKNELKSAEKKANNTNTVTNISNSVISKPEIKYKDTKTVPILMYHVVQHFKETDSAYGVSIEPETFKEQMKYLYDSNYTTLSMADYRDYLENGKKLPEKSVIITFDDGQHSIYDSVFPVIKKYNQKIQVYIITSLSEEGKLYSSWDKLLIMQKSGLVFYGSHTVSHKKLGDLTLVQVEKELVDSKKILEEKLGVPILDFAYPSGSFNEKVVQLVEKSGYKTAVSVTPGTADPDEGMYTLRRFAISRDVDMEKFKEYISDY